MIYLLLTIAFSSIIYVIFKAFTRYQINTFQAIVINYFICAIMGFFLSGEPNLIAQYEIVKPALPYAFGLSILFMVVFSFIGLTSQKLGVAITSMVDRMNLVISVTLAIVFLGDSLSILKFIGILLSIVSIVLIVSRTKNQQSSINWKTEWYYPLIVFAGGGAVAFVLKIIQFKFSEINFSSFLLFAFAMATVIGTASIVIQKKWFSMKNVVAGIVLGIPNYFSLYFFLKALDVPDFESSLVFPLNNISILLLSTVLGIFIYKERLNTKNWLGLGIAIIAIGFLVIEKIYG